MGQLSINLEKAINDAIFELQKLIDLHGVKSKHSDTQVLKIEHDDFMFNLEGGRYLTEISKGTLIDNQGYVYGHYVILSCELVSLIEHLIEVFNEENRFICGVCGEHCNEYTYNESKDVDECNDCKD